MRIITSYILTQLAIAMAVTVTALGMMIWFTQSLRLLELIVSSGAPPELFFRLALLTLPTFLGLVLPISLAVATLFTFHKLATESELIVMRAAGISPAAIGRAAFILAAITSITVFAMDAFISPMANKELERLRYLARGDLLSVMLQPGVFNDVGKSMTVYIRERDAGGNFRGILLYDYRNKAKPATVIAESGAIVEAETGPKVVVFKGNRQERDSTGNLTRLYFDQYTLDFGGMKEELEQRWIEPSSRPLNELFRPPQTSLDKHFYGRLRAELHKRFANSMLPLSLVAAITFIMLTGEYNRRGQPKRVWAACIVLIILQAGFLGLSNISAKHASAIPFLYALASLPALVSYIAVKLRRTQEIDTTSATK